MSSSLRLSPRLAIIQFFFEHDQVFSIAIDVAAFVLVAIRTVGRSRRDRLRSLLALLRRGLVIGNRLQQNIVNIFVRSARIVRSYSS
jgi:hypothetical protein